MSHRRTLCDVDIWIPVDALNWAHCVHLPVNRCEAASAAVAVASPVRELQRAAVELAGCLHERRRVSVGS